MHKRLENRRRPMVLLVEDEPLFQSMLQFSLRNSGFDVVLADNGMEALHKLEESNFQLVITDVMMPFMDGFTFLERLRHSRKELPVMVISSLEEELISQRLEHYQRVHWMRKPLLPGEVEERVRSLMTAF